MPSSKTEKTELLSIGATPTRNSGRGKTDKGDGILSTDAGQRVYTVDVKEYGKSYPFSYTNLLKIQTDAHTNKTQPLLHLVIGPEEPRLRWVAVTETMFMEMWEAYKEKLDNE